MAFDGWSPNEFRMFDEMAVPDAVFNDWRVQALYDNALFDYDNAFSREEHHAIMNALREYLMDEYGINFDEVFNWEDYRESYDAA